MSQRPMPGRLNGPCRKSIRTGSTTPHNRGLHIISKRCENAKGEPAVGGGGVDLRPGAGQHFQAHPPDAQILGRVDQVLEVAPKPVELPQDKRVAGLKCLETGNQAGTRIMPAGREVLVDALRLDAGLKHRITLRGERLAAIAFRDPDVADEHGRKITRKEPGQGGTWYS